MANIIIPFTGWYSQHLPFKVKFNYGVTILVGKNGSGKTSMINEINAFLKKKDIPVFLYNHLVEGASITSRNLSSGDIEVAATYMQSSEGEKVVIGYGSTLRNIHYFLDNNRDKEYVFLLCDGLDSGVSINIIKEFNEIFNLLQNDYPNIVIVNTTNNYEFTRNHRCVVATTGEEIVFDSYDDYSRFICEHE